MKKIKKVVLWVFVFLWMGNILRFSSAPAEISKKQSGFFVVLIQQILSTIEMKWHIVITSSGQLDHLVRKTAHVVNYFVLAILLWLAFFEPGKKGKLTYVKAGLVAFLFSILDEVYQTFIPGRAGMASDVLIDTIGIMLALFLFSYLGRKVY